MKNKKAKKGEVEARIYELIENKVKFGDYIIEEFIGVERANQRRHWKIKVRCTKCNSRKIMRYHTLISNSYKPYTKCQNLNVQFFNNQELYFKDKNMSACRFPLYHRWYNMTLSSKNPSEEVCPEWRVYKFKKTGGRGGHHCINENFINYMNYENYIFSLLDKHKLTLTDIKKRKVRIVRKYVDDGWFPGNILLYLVEEGVYVS